MTADPKSETAALRARVSELKERLEHSEDVNQSLRASIKRLNEELKKADGAALHRRMREKELENEKLRTVNCRLLSNLAEWNRAFELYQAEMKAAATTPAPSEAAPSETPTEIVPAAVSVQPEGHDLLVDSFRK